MMSDDLPLEQDSRDTPSRPREMALLALEACDLLRVFPLDDNELVLSVCAS